MTMTPRERELAAIRHELPDRIPVDVICIENAEQIAKLLRIEPEQVYEALGIDGRIVSAGYVGEVKEGLNEWGSPNTGDYGTGREYPISAEAAVADVERYPGPKPEDYDYVKAGKAAKELGKQYAVRGPYWKPLFCQVCDLVGMEAAMVMMHERPRVFEALVEKVFTHVADYSQRLLDACGDDMPIYCLGDDFATQRGLMISPGQWRRFLKPYYARLFDIAKYRGKFVWFHSCGDITAVLGDLIDIGLDVWETVQLHTLPIPAEKLKSEYGRHVTFFGGINTQRLPFASPADIREEVVRVIGVLGKGGGYICGPDHHVKPDVPAENAVALFDEARKFRRVGYTTGM